MTTTPQVYKTFVPSDIGVEVSSLYSRENFAKYQAVRNFLWHRPVTELQGEASIFMSYPAELRLEMISCGESGDVPMTYAPNDRLSYFLRGLTTDQQEFAVNAPNKDGYTALKRAVDDPEYRDALLAAVHPDIKARIETAIAPLSDEEYDSILGFLFEPTDSQYADQKAIFDAMPSHKRVAAITRVHKISNISALALKDYPDDVHILLANLSPTERLTAITAFVTNDGDNALRLATDPDLLKALLTHLTPDQQWTALTTKKSADALSALDVTFLRVQQGGQAAFENLITAVDPQVRPWLIAVAHQQYPEGQIRLPLPVLTAAFTAAGARTAPTPYTPHPTCCTNRATTPGGPTPLDSAPG